MTIVTKLPRSLLCPDCNIPMKFSHTYEEPITPPSGTSTAGTASQYGNVDEYGYGSQTIYIYVCPKCKCESNSGIKFPE